jgi:RHS repeat-associated protein
MNQLTGITHPDSSTETLSYDDNGNLLQSINNTTGEVTTYTWDVFNRLTGAVLSNGEVLEFGYQADKMLIKEKADGMEKTITNAGLYGIRETIKKGDQVAKLSVAHTVVNNPSSIGDLSGQILSSRLFSPEGIYGSDSGDIYYHPDHLGSVRLITDQNGNIKDRLHTDAYGNTLPMETAQSGKPAKSLQPLNFIGSYGIRYLHKIKMYNMRARWHNTQTARFTSTDEIFSTNRFNYVSGNPVMMNDPTGMHEIMYRTLSSIESVDHEHADKYSWLAPSSFLKDKNKIDEYNRLIGKFKEDNLMTLDLINLSDQASNDYLSTYIDRWKSNKTKIIENRYEYKMNCAGFAFSGKRAVEINNKPQTAVRRLLVFNYRRIHIEKIKDLKQGDIILQAVKWRLSFVNGFNHVRTVALITKNKKNKCINALIHEVDGYRPIVITLLDGNNLQNDEIVFRPIENTNVLYWNNPNSYEVTKPYKKIIESDGFYLKKLSEDPFYLDIDNLEVQK